MVKVAGTSIVQLRRAVKGAVIVPDDAGYEDARKVWLKGVDRRPRAIVRTADREDVARVVAMAGEEGIELAVRSGGHSFGGYGTSEGGVVIDLSDMKGLEIDLEGRTAWAETGLTAGEYTAAVGAHGMATPLGDSPTVGLGGLTLGG
ncbi:MAG TPA: FAD-dependent oxidoreductase, partial [Longimicrobiaceae bacterium]|nr:FAD-dependent oxidoreductase [Longimicrobiaceae bacterium]